MWLNGVEVHRKHAHRSLTPGDDVVVASVRKGDNKLLLKIENGGGWGFCVEPIDVLGWIKK
ncbi:MAG: hypothetical protein ACE5I1_29575 [bacterium]